MPLLVDGFYVRSVPTIEWDEEQLSYVVAVDEENEKQQQRMNAWNLIAVDMVYLALVFKCANTVINCSLSTHTIMFVSFILTIMFTTRLWFDDYFNRFYENDIFHRILFFAYILCSFIMVLNVNSVSTNGHPDDSACRADLYGVAFGGGFLATRFIILILYISVVVCDKKLQALHQFWGHMMSVTLSGFVAFSLLMVEYSNPEKVRPSERIDTYIACMAIEFSYHTWHHYSLAFSNCLRNLKCPCSSMLAGKEVYVLNIPQYRDRISSFVMVILGEVLVKNLVRYYDISYEMETYGYSVASMSIVFFYGLLYYDATNADGDHHALTHSILSSYLYIWCHLLLGIACFFSNAALGVLFELSMPAMEVITVEKEEPSDDKALMFESTHKPIFTASTLLATSMGITLIMLGVINLLHKGISQICCKGDLGVRRAFAFKIFIAVLHFSVPGFHLAVEDSIDEVVVHVVLLALAVLFEIRFSSSQTIESSLADDAVENKQEPEDSDKDSPETTSDEIHEENKVEDTYKIPRYISRRRRPMKMRDDFEYGDVHKGQESIRRVRETPQSRRLEAKESLGKASSRLEIPPINRTPLRHAEDELVSETGSVQNANELGTSRRQSLQFQAAVTSPAGANIMTIAAPKSNPLDRRGSLLGSRTNGRYQESMERRKSKLSALTSSLGDISLQGNPMHPSV